MSIALLITPATTSNFHPPCNENKSNFPRTKLGVVHKKDFLEPSVLKIETNPKSRFFKSAQALVHKVCKCCVGFGSVAAKCGAASSTFDFNISDFGDYEGRVDLERKEGVTIAGSDSNIGSGGGGHGESGSGDGGGGGDNTGNGRDGVGGESAGWEGVKWCCWWLFEAWKNYYQFGGYPISTATFSRMAVPIIQEIVGSMMEPELEAILMALFLPIFMLPVAVFTGLMMIAMEEVVILLALGMLGIGAAAAVMLLFILFWEFSQHRKL